MPRIKLNDDKGRRNYVNVADITCVTECEDHCLIHLNGVAQPLRTPLDFDTIESAIDMLTCVAEIS